MLAGWLAGCYLYAATNDAATSMARLRAAWPRGARDPVGGGEKSAAQSTACQLVAGRQAVGEGGLRGRWRPGLAWPG